MTGSELEPITPQEARDLYFDNRSEELAHASMEETVRPGVNLFVEWCEHAEIENMNDLTGRRLLEYKKWVKEATERNRVSLNGLLSVLRRFLVFCVRIEAVTHKLPNKTPVPKLSDEEEVSDEKPSEKEVEETLQYLRTYEPASRRHVEYEMAEELSLRAGALRGLDECDVNIDEQTIDLNHRPEPDSEEKETPLKNGSDGERTVNISTHLAELLRQYLDNPDRHEVTDKYGRKPLLTTRSGRPSVDTIRRDLYKITRPCVYGNTCPHDRNIDTCRAAANAHASECPSSHSPHPLRRYSIEQQIEEGVPKDVLSDRVDVSVSVLKKHYDTRSEERRRKQRLNVLEKLMDGYGDPGATLPPEVIEALSTDSGVVDSVTLHQYINAEERLQDDTGTALPERPSDASETPPQDDKQSSLGEFTNPTVVSQPLAAPLLGGLVAAAWVPDRLRRELAAVTPRTEASPWPSPQRTVKGTAAYAVFVGLLAVNFALLDVIPL